MEMGYDDAIDSACGGCGGTAVDWVQVRDGTRRYLCRDCLEPLARYQDSGLDTLPDTPNARQCPGCQQFTLDEDIDYAVGRCPDCAGGEVRMDLYGDEASDTGA